MTTEQIITLAKERLGRDITEQEAQDYIDGKTVLPDEALDIVNGGGHSNASCGSPAKCPQCGSVNLRTYSAFGGSVSFITDYTCNDCGYRWKD